MQLESLALADLTPDPNNARKHDSTNINAIMGSLDQFGQRKPIVVDQRNVVVAGNGTVEAAKRLGWDSISAVRVPADWDADRIKAFALADNRTAELATWDQAVLDAQLAELDEAGWQLEGIGFEYNAPDELENIIEDTLPEKVETRSKVGQVWALGDHRLLVGDSTKVADFEKLMNGEEADLIITDPPYNVDYEGGNGLKIANDSMADDDFAKFLNDAYTGMFASAKEGSPIYVFHADSSGHHFRNELIKTGWLLKQCLIWVKNSFVMGRQDYHWQHEPILYGWKPGAGHTWYGARNKATVIDDNTDISKLGKTELLEIVRALAETTSVIREDKPKRNGDHPTMKPIPLLARLISNSSKRGDLVLDPFGGSGSTLIAAEQLNRRCNVIEYDPKYADVILARWENFTDREAELIHG